MNITKKIFIGISLIAIFALGFVVPSKAHAAVVVNVSSSASTIGYGGSVTISWSSSGATTCTRTDTGATVGTTGNFLAGPLYAAKTFTIDCNDGQMYYQLYRCGDHLTSWETIAKPDGTLQVGNVILGGTGLYYMVTGSTRNDTARTNINYSLALGYPCT